MGWVGQGGCERRICYCENEKKSQVGLGSRGGVGWEGQSVSI